MTSYVHIDTETTGLDEQPGYGFPPVNTVWEVAAVRGGNGPLAGNWCWQLRVDPATVDPPAAAVNRFATRYLMDNYGAAGAEVMVSAAPPAADTPAGTPLSFTQWARQFVAIVDGCVWCGICPDFDVAHLRPVLTRAGQLDAWPQRPWHYQTLDTETLAGGLLGLDAPFSSDTIAAAFALTTPQAQVHTALGDALYSARLHAAVLMAARNNRRRFTEAGVPVTDINAILDMVLGRPRPQPPADAHA